MWSGLWNLQPTAAVQSHYICEIKNILNFFPLPPRALALIFFFSPTMCFPVFVFVNFLSDVLHSSGYPLLFPLPANCLKGIIRKILPCTRPHVQVPKPFFSLNKKEMFCGKSKVLVSIQQKWTANSGCQAPYSTIKVAKMTQKNIFVMYTFTHRNLVHSWNVILQDIACSGCLF